MSSRLTLALDRGDLVFPQQGTIRVLHPRADADLSALDRARVEIVQPFKPDHDAFAAQGYNCVPDEAGIGAGDGATAILFLPRAKALARLLIAQAADSVDLLVVDGQKTDGIDSLLKEIRKRLPVSGPIAKAHGKLFWFHPTPGLFEDWQRHDTQGPNGFATAPGVFSADGIDPASAALAAALPVSVGKRVADLGAGWGYLSRHLLQDPKLDTLDLVEADHTALTCARVNVTDPRARFHWADATTWRPKTPLDAVVMNPPFHTTRAADPALGQAFIATAAAALTRSGTLWMVANRHLPYESTLTGHFGEVAEISGDARFKILRATRPSRPRG